MALGLAQTLTEMNTRNVHGGKGRPARKADNFIAICESRLSRKCGSFDVSQHYEPSWPVTGKALFLRLTVPKTSNLIRLYVVGVTNGNCH
jgi:hypothetical protein